MPNVNLYELAEAVQRLQMCVADLDIEIRDLKQRIETAELAVAIDANGNPLLKRQAE